MALVSMICPECKEAIKVDNTKSYGFCLNCGAKIMLNTVSSNQNTGIGIEQLIQNYAQLAANAKSAGNNSQCEDYCNKIIELDATNAAAWALKASAAGWQSSLSNIRIDEMILCYSKAVQYAADAELRSKIQGAAKEDFKNTSMALIRLQCERFEKWPDAEETQAFTNVVQYLLNATNAFIAGICPIDFDEIAFPAATAICNCAVNTENRITREYQSDNDGHPGDYAFTNFIEKMGYIHNVYYFTTVIGEKDYKNNIIRYKNMITNHEKCINAKSYGYNYYEYSGRQYYVNRQLTDEAKSIRRREISELNTKISKAQRKLQEQEENTRRERNQQYWAAHKKEMKELQDERQQLESELNTLKQQLSDVDKLAAILDLKDEIETLKLERNALGMFKVKQKKAMDETIAENESKLDKLIHEKKDPISRQIDLKTSRIKQIDNELTKDR